MIAPYQSIVPSVSGNEFFLILFKGLSLNHPWMTATIHGHLADWEVGQLLGGN